MTFAARLSLGSIYRIIFYLVTTLNFKRIPIYLACLRRFIIGGRAITIPKSIKTIIIIQTAKMGDMVCTTPVFRATKKFRPDIRLIVFGDKPSLETLENNSDVDERVNIDDFQKLVRSIKKIAPDYACLVLPDFTSLAALYVAGVKAIVTPEIKSGFSTGATLSYNLLKKLVITVPYYTGQYFARQYLKLLEPAGIKSEDTTKHLDFSKAAHQRIEIFLKGNNTVKGRDLLVGMSTSAGNKIKLWPAPNFAKVADYLYQKYYAIIFLLGGPMDKVETAQVINHVASNTKLINCSGLFSIDELKALIANLDLFISVDTGSIYVAEAFSVPTIDIVGPIDEREQPPIGPGHKIVSIHSNLIKPELTVLNARIYNKREARRQAEAITPEMVVGEIDKLFNKYEYK